MAKWKIISSGTVINRTYVDAKTEKEATKQFELGNGYGYKEIDYFDETLDTIEKVEN